MNLPNLAYHHLQDAGLRLEDARRHQANGHYHLAVRACQESVELALKGALRFVSVDPPKQHNVAKVLRQNVKRFPQWFQSVVPQFATISKEMEQDCIPSMYGDEEKLVPPSELFDEADAQSALDKATEVLASCQKLIQGTTAPVRSVGNNATRECRGVSA